MSQHHTFSQEGVVLCQCTWRSSVQQWLA